ncbi:MAG: hypothetical protein R3F20_03715 [Planctomycetota bacterium]
MRRARAGILVVVLGVAAGCRSPESGDLGPTPQVRVEGSQIATGSPERLADFVGRLREIPPAAVVARLVERNPDLALAALRGEGGLEEGARRRLLAFYPSPAEGEEDGRAATLAAIEAARIQGAYDSAAEIAEDAGWDHAALHCRLDALERQTPGADGAAFARALELADRVNGPAAWARLLALDGGDWPARASLPGRAEAWARSARLSLERGDAWSAFLGWRRARAIAPDHHFADDWRLGAGRALLELGRPAEAALEIAPLRSAGGDHARSAEALLGTIEARLDHLSRAIGHFEAALAGDDGWDGAGRALADWATTELLAGRDPAGLELLTRAAERLERDADWEALATLLANEIAWAEARDHGELAGAARSRLARLREEEGVEVR